MITAQRRVGVWTAVALFATLTGLVAASAGAGSLVRRTFNHLTGAALTVSVVFPTTCGLQGGDPILAMVDQDFVLCGRVDVVYGTPTAADPRAETATLRLDPNAVRGVRGAVQAEAVLPGSSLGWALGALAPPEMRERVGADLRAAWERRASDVFAAAGPVLAEHAARILAAVSSSLPAAIAADREAIDVLWTHINASVVSTELKPVLDERVWPAVEKDVRAIGAELSQEIVSELGFGAVMRALWAKTRETVGGSNHALEIELEKLIAERVMPVLKRRAPEVWAAAVRAGRNTADDPVVRAAVARAAARIADDPEVRIVLQRVVKAAVVDNAEVRGACDDLLSDPRLRAALTPLVREAEPVLEKAIRESLLRPDAAGIDMRLAGVLRNVLLSKDRRYLRLVDTGAGVFDSHAVWHGIRAF